MSLSLIKSASPAVTPDRSLLPQLFSDRRIDMSKVLVVEDEEDARYVIEERCKDLNHAPTVVTSVQGAIGELNTSDFDIVVVDLTLPESTPPESSCQSANSRPAGGWEVIREARQRDPHVRIIVVTATMEERTATDLGGILGVNAVIIKKFDHGKTWDERLIDVLKLQARAREAERQAARVYDDEQVEQQLRKVADTNQPVLFTGETGTGKGHFALRLKELSGKPSWKWRTVNCAALGTEEALSIQLFGAIPGFFTDVRDVPGLFELMDENWMVFLDEIGKLPLATQGALLKVIDDRKYQRFPFTPIYPLRPELQATRRQELEKELRGTYPEASDYHEGYGVNRDRDFKGRIVMATNVDLVELVRSGQMLPDFYNRLICFTVEIPPLRLRGQEYIRQRATHVVAESHDAKRKGIHGIEPAAMHRLVNHQWRAGNIRELIHTLEAAILQAAPGARIKADDIRFVEAPVGQQRRRYDVDFPEEGIDYEREVKLFEAYLLSTAVRKGGKLSEAARLLGLVDQKRGDIALRRRAETVAGYVGWEALHERLRKPTSEPEVEEA
jgi:DNA-binding NtrC family response regulator